MLSVPHLPHLGAVLILYKHIHPRKQQEDMPVRTFQIHSTSLHARIYLKQIIFFLCVSVFTVNNTGISMADLLFSWVENILISIPDTKFIKFYPE